MWSGIWSFLKSLPTLLGIVKEVMKLLSDWYEAYERKKRAEELKEAIKNAREKKDTSGIEDFFNPSRARSSSDKPVSETTGVDS